MRISWWGDYIAAIEKKGDPLWAIGHVGAQDDVDKLRQILDDRPDLRIQVDQAVAAFRRRVIGIVTSAVNTSARKALATCSSYDTSLPEVREWAAAFPDLAAQLENALEDERQRRNSPNRRAGHDPRFETVQVDYSGDDAVIFAVRHGATGSPVRASFHLPSCAKRPIPGRVVSGYNLVWQVDPRRADMYREKAKGVRLGEKCMACKVAFHLVKYLTAPQADHDIVYVIVQEHADPRRIVGIFTDLELAKMALADFARSTQDVVVQYDGMQTRGLWDNYRIVPYAPNVACFPSKVGMDESYWAM